MSITTAGRTLSAGMVAEVTTVQLAPVILVSLSFPSAYTRLWTGYGTLTYAGGTAITYSNAKGVFRLAESRTEWSIELASIYGITFSIAEDVAQ